MIPFREYWKKTRIGDRLLNGMSLLEHIHDPQDLKNLKERELRILAEEIRAKILKTVRKNGGHLSSNLGVIELTIALHRVFDSPKDAIVWDVGHQSYAHKLLTGRAKAFRSIRKKGGLSGFPKRSESIHDIFDTGHSSTSLSSALGLLEARSRLGQEGHVIAVIGDGALTAGMAYEALGNISQLGLPLIIILNDNKMSISRNVGAVSRYLSRLSASVRYQSFRSAIDSLLLKVPHAGPRLLSLIIRGKRAVKAIFFKENLFADFGLEYVGPIDGHNIPVLLQVLEEVKQIDRPVVVHVVTTKGKGDEKAEDDPEQFHGIAPACPDESEGNPRTKPSRTVTFTEIFGSEIAALAVQEPRLSAVTAAMAKGTGLSVMKKLYPSRVYDVGIAEQHAVTFAAGLARGGLKPVVAIYSTFLQRAVDQVFQDVALADLPVIFAVDRAGAVGDDGETHQGLYDIAIFKSMPNLILLAPSSAGELKLALHYAVSQNHPVMIRFPKDAVSCEELALAADFSSGRGVFVRKNNLSRLLVCAAGPLAMTAAVVSDRLQREGVPVDVFNLRFLKPLDTEYLTALFRQYERIVSIEDGVVRGGIGESLQSVLASAGISVPLTCMGFSENPLPQAARAELLASACLDEAGLYAALKKQANFEKGALPSETITAACK